MKKVLFGAVAAMALLCCSCQSDECQCTIKSKDSTTIKNITREDGKKCSDYNDDGTIDTGLGGVSINTGVTVKCKNA